MGRALIGVLIPLAGVPSVSIWAATADDVRGIEDTQVQLRTQTQRVAGEIDAVILEFQRNGLSEGQDIETLKGVRAILGKLSGSQMEQVIQLLQQARNTGDAAQSRENVVKAVKGQQDVVSNLQALLTTYKHQQQMYQLAAKFAQTGRPAGIESRLGDRAGAVDAGQAARATRRVAARLDQRATDAGGGHQRRRRRRARRPEDFSPGRLTVNPPSG